MHKIKKVRSSSIINAHKPTTKAPRRTLQQLLMNCYSDQTNNQKKTKNLQSNI